MKCNEINDILPLYADKELSSEEMQKIEEHILSCEHCKNELNEYKNILNILKSMPDEEPPEGYCQRLHEKLVHEAGIKQEPSVKQAPRAPKTRKLNRWMKYGGIAASLVLMFLVYVFTNQGMSKNSADNYGINYQYGMKESAPQAPEEVPRITMEEQYNDSEDYKNKDQISVSEITGNGSYLMMSETVQREMKIVKTGEISAQTENYDTFFNNLVKEVNVLGGFLENSSTEVYQMYENKNLMYGSLKIRVPQESFYEIINYLENNAEVRRKNINEIDLTKEYYEKDNKVKNLEIQEQSLRNLFEKANTVEEMLLIENELRRVRTEIDSINISLSDIDDRASMSTVDLTVEEVMTASFGLKTKKSVWDRSKDGFINTVNSIINSMENLLVNIISNSPILIPVILICTVGFLKIRKYRRRNL